MPFDLEAELARRLGVSRDAVGPVLDAVIERIRQQVSHYGYARVAGLGTFRGQNGHVAFEPDPVLADEVNVRYAGLENVSVAVREDEDRDEDEVLYGESPGDDYERSDSGTADEGISEDVEDADEYIPPSFPPAEIPHIEEEPDPPELADADEDDELAEGIHAPFQWEEEIDSTESHEHDVPPTYPADSVDDPTIDAPADDAEPGSEEEAEPAWEDEAEPAWDEETEPAWEDEAEPAWEDDAQGLVNEDAEPAWEENAQGLVNEDVEPAWEDDAGGLRGDLAGGARDDDTGPAWEDASEEHDMGEDDDSETWFEDADEVHPLGPVPETPFEEADYSVLDEQRTMGQAFGKESGTYADNPLEGDRPRKQEFQDQGAVDDDADGYVESDGGTGSEPEDDLGEDLRDRVEGPSVEWNALEEQVEDDPYAEEEAAMAAAGGAAFGDDDEIDRDLSHEKAPDRSALPHERIRQHPPRRHAAARASGTGAAGGNRNAIWIGVGVLVLVAAAAVAYFVLVPTVPPDERSITDRTETPAPIDTGATASSDAEVADTSAAAVPPVRSEETTPLPPVRSEETSPLRSAGGIDRSAGGFTIIVYSETSERGAAEAAAPFRDRGYRTSVLEYHENGRTRYRVGVGQFATLEEAGEARDRLAGSELPDDAWVWRVQ